MFDVVVIVIVEVDMTKLQLVGVGIEKVVLRFESRARSQSDKKHMSLCWS